MEYGCSQVGAICATHKKPQALEIVLSWVGGMKPNCTKKRFANSSAPSQTICVSKNSVPPTLLLFGVPALLIVGIVSKYTPIEFDRLLAIGWVAFMVWLWFEADRF